MALELRPIEMREGRALTGQNPMDVLALSLSRPSPCYLWVVTYWDKICGVFGLTLFEEGLGVPWFVSNEVPFSDYASRGLFLRKSRDLVSFMKSRCTHMINYVSLENTKAVRWLRWLGFTIDENETYTFDRDPDLRFCHVRMGCGKGGETDGS